MTDNVQNCEGTLSIPSRPRRMQKKPTRLLIRTDSYNASVNSSNSTNLSPVVAQLNRISFGNLSPQPQPVFSVTPPTPHQREVPRLVLTPTDNLTSLDTITTNFSFSPDDARRKSMRKATIRQRTRETTSVARKDKENSFRLESLKWVKTIGTGTFGRVVLCEDLQSFGRDKKYYAMKMLRISDVFRLRQVEHIRDEKRILEKLDHPFIVKLFWSHHDSTNLYMLLEYAPGGELFSYLRSVVSFDSPTAVFYAAEILLALEYLHSLNIVYRDLKPENLIFDREGHIKLTDFGFAKELTDRTWTLCGTPEYLAPEIIQSRGYNKAVDYWAYGVLIFEMLAGHPPFFSDNPIEIYQKIIDGRIRWPKQIDLVAKDIIRKLLVADRTKRLGSMKNGAQDVKNHRWFRSLPSWEACYNRQIEPPYVPDVRHPGDTRNFDDYSESWMSEKVESVGGDESLAVFDDF